MEETLKGWQGASQARAFQDACSGGFVECHVDDLVPVSCAPENAEAEIDRMEGT